MKLRMACLAFLAAVQLSTWALIIADIVGIGMTLRQPISRLGTRFKQVLAS